MGENGLGVGRGDLRPICKIPASSGVEAGASSCESTPVFAGAECCDGNDCDVSYLQARRTVTLAECQQACLDDPYCGFYEFGTSSSCLVEDPSSCFCYIGKGSLSAKCNAKSPLESLNVYACRRG